jgi:hypothetical protein
MIIRSTRQWPESSENKACLSSVGDKWKYFIRSRASLDVAQYGCHLKLRVYLDISTQGDKNLLSCLLFPEDKYKIAAYKKSNISTLEKY